MSELQKIVSDIEIQSKFRSVSKETQERRETKRALEEEIKQLEDTYFRQSENCNERERMEFVSECRKKLKVYEDYFNENEKLKMFVDLWRSKKITNGELIRLPEVIKETARKMVSYYEAPLEPTLVMAAKFEEQPVGEIQLPHEARTSADSSNGEREPDILPGPDNLLGSNSDLMMDSQIVDSSRLRVSVLDTSIIPQKGRSVFRGPLQFNLYNHEPYTNVFRLLLCSTEQ
ncbi:hypothetical protein FBUS_08564 [Fasciolopsis buskii]|uniref:Uncharacterized protein n=1 Tax=Fasciolopsis buskii TaxID=27845 RepID=A0A8E0S0Y5_9TREM|nr:hypothetical protein FBUS_08564 [Fasciolopsis buski]